MNKPKNRSKQSKKLSKQEQDEIYEDIINTQANNNKLTTLQKIKVDIKCKTENQKKFIKLIESKEIVICAGLAGTGKTFLSCCEALKLLKADKGYKKIVLIKSVTTLKEEALGYVKGTIEQKMEPFIMSFMGNFHKIIGNSLTDNLVEQGYIEVQPIAYIRGLSIDNAIVVVDEAQNISIDNMRTIITRLGHNSKLIFIGDTRQIDMKNKKESSLDFMIKHFSHINVIGTIQFGKEDIVRNPIIQEIEDTFDKLEENGIYTNK